MKQPELVKIGKIKPNPDNPRTIAKDKLDQLVKSLETLPEMLQARPIVVNSDMMVLGGNMRLQAAKKAGFKEVWVLVADTLDEAKQMEFMVKDNSNFGQWDWDALANNWDNGELQDWGLDVWNPLAAEPDKYHEPEEMEPAPSDPNHEHEPSLTLLIDFPIDQFDEALELVNTHREQGVDFEELIFNLLQEELLKLD